MKKKIVTLLMVSCLTLSVTACGSSSTSQTPQAEPQSKEIESSIPVTAEIEETILEEQTTKAEEEGENNDSNTGEPAIELIAGEQGQYGKLITMSEGTDMEESFYVYYLPAGTYEVTNKGEYMTQVSVYEGFTKNEETGYDEYTEIGSTVLIDVEKTNTIEVPEGWLIEIHEPTHISLTLVSE